MRHGSLFSGIGGFDLAAEWMGWENVFHCEWNEFGQKVLQYYWPNAISYENIKETDFTNHRGKIDILTGGFPCQPYSAAGKRKGKEDERHLWPHMLRAIREIQPRWIVGENVYGLVNWSGGLVFDEIQADLEAEGYEVQPVILPACAVNAPHRRDRIWFVANSKYNRHKAKRETEGEEREIQKKHREELGGRKFDRAAFPRSKMERPTPNSNKLRREGGKIRQKSEKRTQPNDKQFEGCSKFFSQGWEEFPTQSPVCSGNDGLSSRLDGITFPKWRNESIKAAGNAIVPQVAYEIFKAIEAI